VGYDILISRGYRWAEDESFSPITLEEWKKVVEEIALDPIEFVETVNPITEERIRIDLPNSARLGEDGPLFVWKDGVIGLQCDNEDFDKCRAISDSLAAQIYGEEGETY
jgi:hypothetical protein